MNVYSLGAAVCGNTDRISIYCHSFSLHLLSVMSSCQPTTKSVLIVFVEVSQLNEVRGETRIPCSYLCDINGRETEVVSVCQVAPV